MISKRFLIWYRRILLLSAILLIVVLAWKDTAPNGHLRISHDFGDDSPFVSEIVPLNRTAHVDQGVAIVDEPVYMTVRYPRPFKQLNLALSFLNPGNAFVELGPQIADTEVYERQALNHPQLNGLLQGDKGWERAAVLAQDGTTLWQNRSSSYLYKSPEQFFSQLPDQERTAYYGVTWSQAYVPDFNKAQQPETQTIPVALQGSHRFFVATDGDALRLDVDLIDLNQVLGADEVLVEMTRWDGSLLAQDRVVDDGNTSDDRRFSLKTPFSLTYTGLTEPGVYVVSVQTTTDIVLQGMKFNAPYVVASGHVKIAGGPAVESALGVMTKSAYLTTNARALTASTDHVQTLQTMSVGQESIVLSQPFTPVDYRLASTRRFLLSQGYVIGLEQGNVDLVGRGVFAFSASAYFSPTPWIFDDSIDAEAHEIDYVISDYVPPVAGKNGLMTQTVSVDLAGVYAPQQNLRFQLAVSEASVDQSLILKHMTLDFLSDPIRPHNVVDKFKRFIEREF